MSHNSNQPVSDRSVLIVGAGPAGYTAAIYTARAGINTTILCGPMIGGQLSMTTKVENYPGFNDFIVHKLTEAMHTQCINLGVKIVERSAVSLEIKPLGVVDSAGDTTLASAVIVATGASPKALGIKNEVRFMSGGGVSTCAVCDGACFRGKTVAVVGGGNTAVEDTIYLSRLAKHVHLIHRRDKLRAEQMLQNRLFALDNITFHWNSQVASFEGKDSLEYLVLDTDGTQTKLVVDGAFVAIGHVPNTHWCSDNLATDGQGYIVTKSAHGVPGVVTEVPGVFAAGDAVDSVYRQAITSAGQGCMAGIEATKYIQSLGN